MTEEVIVQPEMFVALTDLAHQLANIVWSMGLGGWWS